MVKIQEILFMKHILLAIAFVGLLSCSKKEEINPDFTVDLVGTYTLSYVKEGSQEANLPSNGVSGNFKTTKVDDTHLNLVFTYQLGTTSKPIIEQLGSVELKRTGTKQFDVYLQNEKHGTITPSDISLYDTSLDGTYTEFRGKR